jgi:ADP-ribose pyrophosphatase YjhB (NUDIX family)
VNLDRLEDYGLEGNPWTALTFIRVFSDYAEGMDPKKLGKSPIRFPLGFVFVIQRERPRETFYKLPGGRQNFRDQSPLYTALREDEEETGLVFERKRLRFAGKELVRANPARIKQSAEHYRCLFNIDIYEREMRGMHNFHEANGGEFPEFLTVENTQNAIDNHRFMPDHLNMCQRCGLLFLPLGQRAAA